MIARLRAVRNEARPVPWLTIATLRHRRGAWSRQHRPDRPEMAFDLARAAGEGSDGPVLIGRDTRRSGPMLTSALHAGFNSVGVDTIDVGIIPVGAVSRLARDTGSQVWRDGQCLTQSRHPTTGSSSSETTVPSSPTSGGRHRRALPPWRAVAVARWGRHRDAVRDDRRG